ncbi:hypothetical protein Pmani_014911 [Petrolisthes manimaculis]|uniref:Chromo domain-containing protein n=1 Tax=Petrolisthes manimaculis TaxID=1843537 RepID=A0AAE1PUJ2_9EUCA|nr:hypothetical protein Pmani_014911 [Petrolisthes manimaculis]
MATKKTTAKKKEDIYVIEKLLDVKWVKPPHEGQEEEELFRVRWKGYGPSHDTFEPETNFATSCYLLVQHFWEKYDDMRKKVAEEKNVPEASVKHVNILSLEIDRIIDNKFREVNSLGEYEMSYKIKWHGYPEGDKWTSWVPESDMTHAWDLVQNFKHHDRVTQPSSAVMALTAHNQARRVEDREFFDKVNKGQLTWEYGEDLYTRIKSRRAKIQEDEQEEHDARKVSTTSQALTQDNSLILFGLPTRTPRLVEEEFTRMEMERTILSPYELNKAVDENDYQQVFACLHSECVPDVDFSSLFLSTARRGCRDMALLLASRVPDLAVKDQWGQTALIMAARLGDLTFCQGLLNLGVPVIERNTEGQLASDIARHFGYTQVLELLHRYEEKPNMDTFTTHYK